MEFMTTAKFSRMIEKYANELNVPVMDAIVHYCYKNEIEIESAVKMCNSKLKKQIYAEAYQISMVKGDEEIKLKYGYVEANTVS